MPQARSASGMNDRDYQRVYIRDRVEHTLFEAGYEVFADLVPWNSVLGERVQPRVGLDGEQRGANFRQELRPVPARLTVVPPGDSGYLVARRLGYPDGHDPTLSASDWLR